MAGNRSNVKRAELPNAASRMRMKLFDREAPEPRVNERVKAIKAIREVGEKQNSRIRLERAMKKK